MGKLKKHIPSIFLVIWFILIVWLSYKANGSRVGIDDADIFFTYAQNLSAGNGILYSNGIERVEGYTSTLWMLLSALMFKIGIGENGVVVASVCIFILTQIICLNIIDKTQQKNLVTVSKIAYVVLICMSFPYVSWTTVTLMDTGAWGLIIVLMVYLMLFTPASKSGCILSSVVFMLAPLVRPESLFVVPVMLALIFFKKRYKKESQFQTTVYVFSFIVSLIIFECFRIWYFGYLLPNTYYAKVSNSIAYNLLEGWGYFIGFVSENTIAKFSIFFGLISCLLLLQKIVAAYTNRKLEGELHSIILIGVVIVAYTCLPILSGGDHFKLYRFYQPIYPLYLIEVILVMGFVVKTDFIYWLKKYLLKNRLVSLIGCLLAMVSIVVIFSWNSWVAVFLNGSPIAHEFQISRDGRRFGKEMNEMFENSGLQRLPSIGVITAGGIAREYKGSIFDLMGLNNKFIAHYPGARVGIKNHAAFEKGAFFQLPIDIINESPANPFAHAALKGVFIDPLFVSNWRYGNLKRADKNINIKAFFNLALLEELMKNDFTFEELMSYSPEKYKWIDVN